MAKSIIFELVGDPHNNTSYSDVSRKIRRRLNEHRLEIKYSDMYKREIDTITSIPIFKTD